MIIKFFDATIDYWQEGTPMHTVTEVYQPSQTPESMGSLDMMDIEPTVFTCTIKQIDFNVIKSYLRLSGRYDNNNFLCVMQVWEGNTRLFDGYLLKSGTVINDKNNTVTINGTTRLGLLAKANKETILNITTQGLSSAGAWNQLRQIAYVRPMTKYLLKQFYILNGCIEASFKVQSIGSEAVDFFINSEGNYVLPEYLNDYESWNRTAGFPSSGVQNYNVLEVKKYLRSQMEGLTGAEGSQEELYIIMMKSRYFNNNSQSYPNTAFWMKLKIYRLPSYNYHLPILVRSMEYYQQSYPYIFTWRLWAYIVGYPVDCPQSSYIPSAVVTDTAGRPFSINYDSDTSLWQWAGDVLPLEEAPIEVGKYNVAEMIKQLLVLNNWYVRQYGDVLLTKSKLKYNTDNQSAPVDVVTDNNKIISKRHSIAYYGGKTYSVPCLQFSDTIYSEVAKYYNNIANKYAAKYSIVLEGKLNYEIGKTTNIGTNIMTVMSYLYNSSNNTTEIEVIGREL